LTMTWTCCLWQYRPADCCDAICNEYAPTKEGVDDSDDERNGSEDSWLGSCAASLQLRDDRLSIDSSSNSSEKASKRSSSSLVHLHRVMKWTNKFCYGLNQPKGDNLVHTQRTWRRRVVLGLITFEDTGRM
jgi:hypothetical protein